MKTKFLFLSLLISGTSAISTIAQSKVSYTESAAIISNPARGLQKYSITDASYNTKANYTNLSQSTLTGWRTGTDKVTVIYRYFLLDAFLNANLSQTYLANMQKDFDIIRSSGLKCLVRFSYSDAQGSTPQQPGKALILTHINQLSSILTSNKDIIMTLQAGFIGTWGEWYYTNSAEFGTDGAVDNTQWANRKQIVDAMLAAVPADIFIQVRYPQVKEQFYGTGQLNSGTAYQNTSNARIGFFNDAFLNNWGDMGTFSVGSETQTPVGTTDYLYLANETKYTPMTGETNGLNSPRTSGSNAIFEMDSANWTCLNRDYFTDVWNGWISSGNYDEILKRLGYRFVLKSSEFNLTGNNLYINLKIDNKGFASVFVNRKAYLVLQNVSTGTDYKYTLAGDPRTWNKSVVIQETFDLSSLPDGDYKSFLYLPDHHAILASRPEYAIQFANEKTWQSFSGYNELFQIVTKSGVVTDITDQQLSNKIITANPVDQTISIVASIDLSHAEIKLFDTHGHLLSSPEKNGNDLYVGHLSQGVYFIHIQAGGNKYIEKFLKK